MTEFVNLYIRTLKKIYKNKFCFNYTLTFRLTNKAVLVFLDCRATISLMQCVSFITAISQHQGLPFHT